jgi:hypothetical protein
MIGRGMFKDFVTDDLAAISSELGKTFYHLDGIGEIIHLDELLSISGIAGIQWIPGAGEPETQDWSELYEKISASGKKLMAPKNMDSYLDEILEVIKKPDGLIKMQMIYPLKEKEFTIKKLAKYGAV